MGREMRWIAMESDDRLAPNRTPIRFFVVWLVWETSQPSGGIEECRRVGEADG
jgi:hypothetical protein